MKKNFFVSIIQLALYPILLFIGFIAGIWVVNYTNYINSDNKITISTPNTKKSPTIDYDNLETGIKKSLSESGVKPQANYSGFAPGLITIEGKWMFLNLRSNPLKPPKNVDLVIPDLIMAVAYVNENGDVTVVTDQSSEWCKTIPEVPDALLPPDSKKVFTSPAYCK